MLVAGAISPTLSDQAEYPAVRMIPITVCFAREILHIARKPLGEISAISSKEAANCTGKTF